MENSLRNFKYFEDFIENFNGLRNIEAEADLDVAREAIDRLLFDIEGVEDGSIGVN